MRKIKTSKAEIRVEGGMSFFKWLYLGIVLMRIAGVIDWSWKWILAPVVIVLVIALLVVIYPGKDKDAEI